MYIYAMVLGLGLGLNISLLKIEKNKDHWRHCIFSDPFCQHLTEYTQMTHDSIVWVSIFYVYSFKMDNLLIIKKNVFSCTCCSSWAPPQCAAGLTCGPRHVAEVSVEVFGISTSPPPTEETAARELFSRGLLVAIAMVTCSVRGAPEVWGRARASDSLPLERNELRMPLDTRLEMRLTAPPRPPRRFFRSPTSSSSSAGGTSMFPEYQKTHQMRLRKMTMAPA